MKYIGAGGWAYFRVPGLGALEAYTKAFNFVEINSTFYKLPDIETAKMWKKRMPEGFHCSVRANRSIIHAESFLTSRSYHMLEETLRVCNTLAADVLHFQLPPKFVLDNEAIDDLGSLFSTICSSNLKLALEIRSFAPENLPRAMVSTMKDHDVIHCVDLSKGEKPSYQSNTLYTRIFGRGEHNIYQPRDEELEEINKSTTKFGKAYITFHGTKMYKDAARLKIFDETGNFPQITRYSGLDSLAAILKEDALFPTSKEDLLKDQGWKLFDATREKRENTEMILKQLPSRIYYNLKEVMDALKSAKGDANA